MSRLINDVTATAILGNDKYLERTIAALEYSYSKVPFKNIQLLGPTPFSHPFIKWVKIPPHTYEQYSIFCLKELYKYIQTKYCLIIQYDGFIINPQSWTDEFLNYDVVGAVWPVGEFNPVVTEENCCCNGGFSLRSQEFLEATRHIPTWGHFAEDVLWARIHREKMLMRNIKFAPPEVCAKFSIEWSHTPYVTGGQNQNDRFSLRSFGFHGSFHDANKFIDDWRIHPQFKLL